jgi:hypothetical protein
MGITIEYAPDVSALGGLAYQAGYGQRNAERSDLMTRIAAQDAQQARSLAAREASEQRRYAAERERYMQGADLDQIKALRDREWDVADAEQKRGWAEADAVATDKRARGMVDYREGAELDTYNKKAEMKDQRYKMQLDELNHELSLREVGQSSDGGNYSDFTVPQLEQYKDATMRARLAIKDSVPPKPDEITTEGGTTIVRDQYGRVKRVMAEKGDGEEKREAEKRKLRQSREDYWRGRTKQEGMNKVQEFEEDEVRRRADDDVRRAFPDGVGSHGKGGDIPLRPDAGPSAAQASAPVAVGALDAPIIQSAGAAQMPEQSTARAAEQLDPGRRAQLEQRARDLLWRFKNMGDESAKRELMELREQIRNNQTAVLPPRG